MTTLKERFKGGAEAVMPVVVDGGAQAILGAIKGLAFAARVYERVAEIHIQGQADPNKDYLGMLREANQRLNAPLLNRAVDIGVEAAALGTAGVVIAVAGKMAERYMGKDSGLAKAAFVTGGVLVGLGLGRWHDAETISHNVEQDFRKRHVHLLTN